MVNTIRRTAVAIIAAFTLIVVGLGASAMATTQAPSAVRHDVYGAMAAAPSISLATEYYAPTKHQAQTTALRYCRQTVYLNARNQRVHPRDCRLVIWVRNGWIALVSNRWNYGHRSGTWGTGWGRSRSRAVYEAKRIYRSYGGRGYARVRYVHETYWRDSGPTVGGTK
jgi:hypothetical protein